METEDCEGAEVPEQYLSSGAEETDFLLLITVDTSSVTATTGTCQQDPITRRPVAGRIRYKASSIDPDYPSIWKGFTIHEIVHLLGFSSNLFGDYIDRGTNNVLGLSKVLKTTTSSGRTRHYIILPTVSKRLVNISVVIRWKASNSKTTMSMTMSPAAIGKKESCGTTLRVPESRVGVRTRTSPWP
mmetsp:Transcript_60110/g.68416  ORF Transcript_60110/g.68416 Transcript_60110/m.68416 type:complete len:186 (+) Transcript_60110:367-924(+)